MNNIMLLYPYSMTIEDFIKVRRLGKGFACRNCGYAHSDLRGIRGHIFFKHTNPDHPRRSGPVDGYEDDNEEFEDERFQKRVLFIIGAIVAASVAIKQASPSESGGKIGL